MDAPADDLRGSLGALLEFDIGIEDEVADAILGRGVRDRTQESKAAALPDLEPDQPESVERSAGEVQFRLGELSGRVAFVVRGDFHGGF